MVNNLLGMDFVEGKLGRMGEKTVHLDRSGEPIGIMAFLVHVYYPSSARKIFPHSSSSAIQTASHLSLSFPFIPPP